MALGRIGLSCLQRVLPVGSWDQWESITQLVSLGGISDQLLEEQLVKEAKTRSNSIVSRLLSKIVSKQLTSIFPGFRKERSLLT